MSGKALDSTADHRIAHVSLDEETIIWRNADVEQERRVAIFDLIEENTFKPLRSVERGASGPYDLRLSVHEGRLVMDRSEEHTSELQSLMRISYAVFCLKKKKTKNEHKN